MALDFSGGMLRLAERRKARFTSLDITLRRQDALASSLKDGCADRVICGFGVKTLSKEQSERFAARILKPGGGFSLIEISVPGNWLLRLLYMFYLKRIVPIVGRLLLGNLENYRMLGVYTEEFGDCRSMRDTLARHGLLAEYRGYFFGCASGVGGTEL